jgi:hypothetical protein
VQLAACAGDGEDQDDQEHLRGQRRSHHQDRTCNKPEMTSRSPCDWPRCAKTATNPEPRKTACPRGLPAKVAVTAAVIKTPTTARMKNRRRAAKARPRYAWRHPVVLPSRSRRSFTRAPQGRVFLEREITFRRSQRLLTALTAGLPACQQATVNAAYPVGDPSPQLRKVGRQGRSRRRRPRPPWCREQSRCAAREGRFTVAAP